MAAEKCADKVPMAAEKCAEKPREFNIDRALRRSLAIAFVGASVLVLVWTVPIFFRASVFFFVCVAILLAKRFRPSLFESPQPRVIIDRDGVYRELGDGKSEHVLWENLTRVTVMTTDEGPFTEDFFWVLHGYDGSGCLVPNGQSCKMRLLERLQRLPDFDNRAVAEACGSTDRAEFLCWEGAPGQGRVAAEPPEEVAHQSERC